MVSTLTGTPPVTVKVVVQPPTFDELFDPLRLRKTASAIRRETRLLRVRDVLDWADWFISLEGSLAALSQDVISGAYSPSPPTRYEHAKSHGSFRVITSFNMRDAIVYRHICDEALERATPGKVAGSFFSRRHSATPVGKTLTLSADDYHSFFEIWLKFNQYRSHTLLNNAYKVLVVTDITNYFDSIQHDLLIEYLGTAAGQSGGAMGRASAILVMYWLGEPAWRLASLFDAESARRLPKEVARAWLSSVTALRPLGLKNVQTKLVGHQSDDVARLSSFLGAILSGAVAKLGNYKSQKPRWPLSGKFYDARSWLLLHIASSTPDEAFRTQLRKELKLFQALARTIPEKRVVSAVTRRLSP